MTQNNGALCTRWQASRPLPEYRSQGLPEEVALLDGYSEVNLSFFVLFNQFFLLNLRYFVLGCLLFNFIHELTIHYLEILY